MWYCTVIVVCSGVVLYKQCIHFFFLLSSIKLNLVLELFEFRRIPNQMFSMNSQGCVGGGREEVGRVLAACTSKLKH